MGSLSHLRVLDLSRVLAGPWASQIFADLGAEVIKIERPGGGDDTRSWGPPWMPDAAGNQSDSSAYYLCTNRGKHSLAVDLKSKEDFTAPLARWRLLPSGLRAVHPSIGWWALRHVTYPQVQSIPLPRHLSSHK